MPNKANDKDRVTVFLVNLCKKYKANFAISYSEISADGLHDLVANRIQYHIVLDGDRVKLWANIYGNMIYHAVITTDVIDNVQDFVELNDYLDNIDLLNQISFGH